jgi:hypothetical protein
MNIVPAVRIIVDEIVKNIPPSIIAPGVCINCMRKFAMYDGAWMRRIAMVKNLVIWLIFFLPLSPSRCNLWKYGTAMPNNWTTMLAEMYGMIPNAKIEALENAPPENISNKLRTPSEVCFDKADSSFGFTPGRTM